MTAIMTDTMTGYLTVVMMREVKIPWLRYRYQDCYRDDQGKDTMAEAQIP